jgi:phenylacetate-CoA ligase
MPLVRYDTGDLAELSLEPTSCSCGRYMPRIRRINGRQQDAITTPDGRVITSVFVVFDKIPGVLSGQIIQYEPARLLVRIARTEQYDSRSEARLSHLLTQFVGPQMSIEFAYVDPDSFGFGRGTKYRAVISYVSSETTAAVPASSP